MIFVISTLLLTIFTTDICLGEEHQDEEILPDLKVMGMAFIDPGENNLRNGVTTTISITFSNEGQVPVNDSWVLEVYISNVSIICETINYQINPGSTYYYNFTYEFFGGMIYEIILDSNDEIEELNEENNIFETSFSRYSPPGNNYLFIIWGIILIGITLFIFYMIKMKKGNNRRNHERKPPLII